MSKLFLSIAFMFSLLLCGCQKTYWGLYSPSRHTISKGTVTLDLESGLQDTVRIQTGSYQEEFLKEAQDSSFSCALQILTKEKTIIQVKQLGPDTVKTLPMWKK